MLECYLKWMSQLFDNRQKQEQETRRLGTGAKLIRVVDIYYSPE